MAERKSFVLYLDWRTWLDLLSSEQKGVWVSALFNYQCQGQPYDGDDPMVKMAFAIARTTLDRDNEKYQTRCASNARNGQKGGRPRKTAEAAEPLAEPDPAAAPSQGADAVAACPQRPAAPAAELEESAAFAERRVEPGDFQDEPPEGAYGTPSPHSAGGAEYPQARTDGAASPYPAGGAEYPQARTDGAASPYFAGGAEYSQARAEGTPSPYSAGRAERSFEQARRRAIQQLQRERFESYAPPAPPRADFASTAGRDRSRYY